MTRAFTLIELSIVLIIIGLLVGGVLAGRDLIEQAELNAITREWREIHSAVNTLALKYGDGAVPGDWDSASDYFGTDCNASAAVCDGDGDGRIETSEDEDHMAFKHMSLAGIYPGEYLGTGAVIGTDLPTSSFEPAGYWLTNNLTTSIYGNLYRFNITTAASNGSSPTAPAFTPLQAYQLDVKTDDGAATTGRLLSGENSAADCVAAVGGGTKANPDIDSLPGDVDYDLSTTTVECRIWLNID